MIENTVNIYCIYICLNVETYGSIDGWMWFIQKQSIYIFLEMSLFLLKFISEKTETFSYTYVYLLFESTVKKKENYGEIFQINFLNKTIFRKAPVPCRKKSV